MPAFTSIAIGLGAAAVGWAANEAFGGDEPSQPSVDSRVEAATGTGQLTTEEAQTTAQKKAYRSGVLFTSPTGLTGDTNTSTAKLK